MDVTEDLLDLLPISVAVTRESDQTLVVANARCRKIFLIKDNHVGSLPVRELVAAEHLARFDADHVSGKSRDLGSEQEQFRVYRRLNGQTFVGWSRNLRTELSPHGLVTLSLIFEYYDPAEDALNLSGYEAVRHDAIRAQMAQYVAENLNRTLAELKLVTSNPAIPYEIADQIGKALLRAEEFGKRILGLGLMTTDAADAVIKTEPVDFLSAPQRTARNLQGARIAVIDDDMQLAQLIARGLTAAGCSVIVANSRSEAAQVVDPKSLDAAIIDLRLGGDDGRDVAKDLRSDKPHLPILYITAFSHSAALLEMSGENLLRKPFSVQELHHNLIKVMSK